jgi:hypothetical protein
MRAPKRFHLRPQKSIRQKKFRASKCCAVNLLKNSENIKRLAGNRVAFFVKILLNGNVKALGRTQKHQFFRRKLAIPKFSNGNCFCEQPLACGAVKTNEI